MQGPEVLIPLIAVSGSFALIFGIVYLKTKENLSMVEKGMNPKDKMHRPAPFRSLKLGLLLVGAGLGLLAAYIIEMNIRTSEHDEHSPLYFALIAIGGGLGLIASYSIEKKHLLDKKDE
jgi:hypothetical protein